MADIICVGDFEYRRKDLIGHGAFAVVFKGRHRERRDECVAIKVITKKNLSKAQNLLTKEINILKGLKHENVVCLYDCKETPTQVNLVMEYCNGGDLADYLHAKGTLSEDTICIFLKQIASAMKILQSKGIVHRDLKPQNILLSHSGVSHPRPADIKIKIADFGFARFLHGEMMAATLCGSPMYMAPEVIMSREYDAKADLWSIGTIIYQCLTGRAPFMASTPQELKKYYQKSKTISPDIPSDTSSALEDLLLSMLKRSPKDRIEFKDFFRHPFLAGALVRKPSAPVQVPLRKQSPRSIPSSPVDISPSAARDPTGDVRLDIFRRVTPPYDATQLSPSGYQFNPLMSGYVTGCSPQGSRNISGQNDVYSEEDFVMVEHQTSPDQSDGQITSNASDPLFPVFSSSPKASKFHRPESPLATGSQRKATFIVGSPSSGSPSSSPLSRGLFNRSPSRNSPSPKDDKMVPPKSSPSSKTSSSQTSGKSSPSAPIPIGGSSPRETPQTRDDGYSRSAPIMVPHPRRSSFSSSLKTTQASPTNPMSQSPKPSVPSKTRSPSGVSNFGTSSNPRHSPVITPTHSPKQSPAVSPVQPPNMSPILSPTQSPKQSPGSTPTQSPNISPLVAVFSPYSPKKARAGTEVSFSSLLNNSHKPIVKTRSSPSLSTTGAWALEAKSRRMSPISKFDLKPLESPPETTGMESFGFPYRSPTAGALARVQGGAPAKPSLLKNVLGSSPTPSYEGDDMKPLKGIFFAQGVRFDVTPGQQQTVTSQVLNTTGKLEGQVIVDVPSLSSETLMERDHIEGVRKLRLSLSYADAIIDVLQTKSTPLRALSESMTVRQTDCFNGEQLIFVNNEYRKAEQLALCIKVLRLLNSMLVFAKEEIKYGRLQPSDTVKSLIKDLNERNHQCLNRAKQINQQMSIRVRDLDASVLTLSADKLIYQHALEMSQIAALDELFGDAQLCKERYEKAVLLLRSLEDDARSERDRALLNKYQNALNFRISALEKRIAQPKIVKLS
ncbi:serine/threonine-protein kinase ULK2-like [Dendronephthya gigantea]|uniref:serine/threonine-protein kinase ULK2-like n=1 Tax=Dendronephthya gigantea TaxID=151771 RepID=UPI00106A1D15|nr:serine/threonine-protein kinase ULK2-like [Dendronephthya gigantea]